MGGRGGRVGQWCGGKAGRNEPHIVNLKLALALVLLLEVAGELVEDGTTAAPLGAEARWAADLVDLQAGLLIWNGTGQEHEKEGR